MAVEKDFCFCVLALKSKYRLLAKTLAKDLEQYGPGITLVIGTDQTADFQDCNNVSAFKLNRQGILHCYHDKRFVIERALTQFQTAIQLDADTRITGTLPKISSQPNQLAAIHTEPLLPHVTQYNPERLALLEKVADKMGVSLDSVTYVGESLFAVSAGEQANAFLQHWDAIARYLELHGIHAGEGNAIGLAAKKAGLTITQPDWLTHLNQVRAHMDVSFQGSRLSSWDKVKRKLGYHYRLNKARVAALKDFNFYYQ